MRVGMSGNAVYRIVYNTGSYFSNNSGVTWNPINVGSPISYGFSYDGKYILVAGNSVYQSSDYGVNWINTKLQQTSCNGAAVSYDGQYQLTTKSGLIFISSNFGDTWSQISISGLIPVGPAATMSRDGKYQAVCSADASTGRVYISTNYGASWSMSSIGVNPWYSISMSSNAKYMSAVPNNANLQTSQAAVLGFIFAFNLDNGTTFFITGTAPTQNYRIDFTISILNTSRSYLIQVINTTTTAANYYCNAVTINGTAVTSPQLLFANTTITGALATIQEFTMHYNASTSVWNIDSNVKKYA
jgi:hypothetical protein